MLVELSREEISLIRFCSVMDTFTWADKIQLEKRKEKPNLKDLKAFQQLQEESSLLHNKFIDLCKQV